MDVEKSLFALRRSDDSEETGGNGFDGVGPISCMTCLDTGAGKWFLCGGPSGALRKIVVTEPGGPPTGQDFDNFAILAQLPSEHKMIEKAVSSPVSAVALLSGSLVGLCLFSLWQSNQVYLGCLGTSGQDHSPSETVLSICPASRSRTALGAIESLCAHSRVPELFAFGTDNGRLFVARLGLHGDFNGTETPIPSPQLVLEEHGPHGTDGLICALDFCDAPGSDKILLASASADGVIRLWGDQMVHAERSQGRQNQVWGSLFSIQVEPSPVRVLDSFAFQYGAGEQQNVLVAGAENGTVCVWDLDAAQAGAGRQACLASLGNFCEVAVHCVAVDNENSPSRSACLLAVGDDSGSVRIYAAPVGDRRRALAAVESYSANAWELVEKRELESPVVAATFHADGLFVATCERGIAYIDPNSKFGPEPAPADANAKLVETSSLSDHDSVTGEETISSYPSPLPQPTPIEKPFDPLSDEEACFSHSSLSAKRVNASASRSQGVSKKRDGGQQQQEEEGEEEEEEEDEEEEEEEREEEGYGSSSRKEGPGRDLGRQRTCYEGTFDRDIPPLPLSKYQEPCLNSSEKVLRAIEKLRLATFDYSNEYASSAASSQNLGPRVLTRAATKSTTVPKGDKLYHGLVPIDPEQAIVAAPRRRPVVCASRKTIMERQEEEIEKHRLQRLSKEMENYEPNIKENKSHVSRSPSRADAAKNPSHAEGEDQGNSQVKVQDGQNETKSTLSWLDPQSLPWAKQEFYLTKQEDGKVGFHNFRSLSFASS